MVYLVIIFVFSLIFCLLRYFSASGNSAMTSSDLTEGFTLEELDENHKNYKWIGDKMKKTIAEHAWGTVSGYKIIKVYKVKNKDLFEKYQQRREKLFLETGLKLVKEVRLFHGTNHAHKIAKEGFRVDLASKTGMFGQGIYFSDLSSKSNQYTFEGCRNPCKDHREILCEDCVRTMLVCRVALGNEYHTDSEIKGITDAPKGFHCVIGDPGKNLQFSEHVVYNNFQAYPGHLVEYKILK